jgi:hypothetical protein
LPARLTTCSNLLPQRRLCGFLAAQAHQLCSVSLVGPRLGSPNFVTNVSRTVCVLRAQTPLRSGRPSAPGHQRPFLHSRRSKLSRYSLHEQGLSGRCRCGSKFEHVVNRAGNSGCAAKINNTIARCGCVRAPQVWMFGVSSIRDSCNCER